MEPTPTQHDPLAPALIERVLERLRLPCRPEPDLQGLRLLYARWCQEVPFDNIRKLLHLQRGDAGPLAGDDATEFFEAWLAHGTGGTCWPAHGALHSLLSELGFRTERSVGTMMASANPPPGHGTVVVHLDGERYLADASILHGDPLLLQDEPTAVAHPAWGVRCSKRDGRWHIFWHPLHRPEGFDCRIEYLGATRDDFRHRHEMTRPWSPFNYAVTLRCNRDDRVIGTALGKRVEIQADGQIRETPLARAEQLRQLIEDFGISEELVMALPADTTVPPPPPR
jgi:N-hydroxyarylamine O-acetyltransferase